MRTFEEEVALNDPRTKLRPGRMPVIMFCTVAIVLGGAWLFGILDAPTGFDAYRQARQYVKKRVPLTTEFQHEDWSRDLPFDEKPDGTVYCHFYIREPGQKDFRLVLIVMKRTLRFYRMEL